jgi:hypothetical protein
MLRFCEHQRKAACASHCAVASEGVTADSAASPLLLLLACGTPACSSRCKWCPSQDCTSTPYLCVLLACGAAVQEYLFEHLGSLLGAAVTQTGAERTATIR